MFSSDISHNGSFAIMSFCIFTSVSLSMDKTIYNLNIHVFYLDNAANFTKVLSTIEHPTAETYPWKKTDGGSKILVKN